MKFTASMDTMSRVITVGVTVLFIGISALPVFTSFEPRAAQDWIMYGTAVLVWLTYLASWLFRPEGYELLAADLIIHRPLQSRVITLVDIASVETPEPKKMRWSIRLFGSGGLFGYFGKFRNVSFGIMNWYATRMENFTVIKLRSGEKIVLTPDDGSFAAHLRSAAGLAELS